MATIINAGQTALTITPDATGQLTLQANGTNALQVTANGQITTANAPLIVTGSLNAPTGVLATQNGMTGICKAWVKFSVSGSTVTINGNFNISSVTRTAQGKYTFTFSTNMPNANYSVVTSQGLDPTGGTGIYPIIFYGVSGVTTPTTSSFDVAFAAPSTGGAYDPAVCGLVVNAS